MIKSRFIQEEISYWASSSPFWEEYFTREWVKGLIPICDAILLGNPAIEILMSNFIAGLALYPISIKSKSEQQTNEALSLMLPVIKLIVSDINSEERQKYLLSQEITGQVKVRVGNETEPISITIEELFQHIGRTGVLPITRADVLALEKDWKRYIRIRHHDETNLQPNSILVDDKNAQPSNMVKAWIVYFEKKYGNYNSVRAAIAGISIARSWNGSQNTLKNGYNKINKIENNKEAFTNKQKSDLITAISLLSGDLKINASKYYLKIS